MGMKRDAVLDAWRIPFRHALLKGAGFTTEQIKKPLIGVLNGIVIDIVLPTVTAISRNPSFGTGTTGKVINNVIPNLNYPVPGGKKGNSYSINIIRCSTGYHPFYYVVRNTYITSISP